MNRKKKSLITRIVMIAAAVTLVWGKPLTALASGTGALPFSFEPATAYTTRLQAPYAADLTNRFTVPSAASLPSYFTASSASSLPSRFTALPASSLPSYFTTSSAASLPSRFAALSATSLPLSFTAFSASSPASRFTVPSASSLPSSFTAFSASSLPSRFTISSASSLPSGFTAPSAAALPSRITAPSAAASNPFTLSSASALTAAATAAAAATAVTVPAPAPAAANQTMRGIDVSAYQGEIDWARVKASGISFAIIRCGFRAYGSGQLSPDSYFDRNIRAASAAGIKVGVYFFSSAISIEEAREEAEYVLNRIRGYGLHLPVFIDMESPADGRAINVSYQTRTDIVKTFCNTVQAAGYKAGVYANKTWFNSYMNTPELTQYTIWLAHWTNAAKSDYSRTRHDIWQYTSDGSVPGINGRVDMNISYVHY